MTEQVMIKSRTGAMVPARVGMVVRWNAYWYTIQGVSPFILSLIDNPRLTCAAPLEDCTMLHCPFQVGDEAQEYINSFDDWGSIKVMTTEMMEDDLSFYRHASLDLRDAPDYKPQEN